MKTSDIVARLTELQERADEAKAAWLFWRTKAELQVSFYDDKHAFYHRIEVLSFIPDEMREELEVIAFERWKNLDNVLKRVEEGDISVLNNLKL